jgi:GntR family transcriptional regulator
MAMVGRFSTRPLYLQVKDMLIERIAMGAWKPGAAIPNEIELSRELGISVGTVRKALDELENERLICRRQGRGTFVIDQTSTESALRFTSFRNRDGMRVAGDVESCAVVPASANEREGHRLQIRNGEPVFRLQRMRTLGGDPFTVEESTVPQSRFPGLADEDDVPSSIVVLAHRYGALLARVEERISVRSADARLANLLKVDEDTPLLSVDCVVYAIDGRPVEWRLAYCHMRENYYLSEIG